MAKSRTVFFCRNCGAESAKWIGKCPSCSQWNTYVEEVVHKSNNENKPWKAEQQRDSKPIRLHEIDEQHEQRVDTSDRELNRVLGGGVVPGSVILLGGEPGIGKSTLLLQLALQMTGHKIAYVSGEESVTQLKLRASRISGQNEAFFILTETNTQKIFRQCKDLQPEILIVDSIQTVFTDLIEATPGSISQIRECAGELQRFAKETGTSVVLVGHITKDGMIAGPKVLEHMVDVVLQFEGDTNNLYRILRSAKNRFGSTDEIGIYEMTGTGLREVENPSQLLLTDRLDQMSGICIASVLEGMRPLMVESQALVTNAVYGTAQRSSTGFDLRRLHMLLAVLEKRSGFKLGLKDVFLNIAGGIKIIDPAMDLAVISAIISSYEDQPVNYKYAFAGEVGLSGEVRSVNRVEQRIAEAEKLGFSKFFVSAYSKKALEHAQFNKIQIVYVSKVYELLSLIF